MEPRENALGWLVAPTYELTRRIFEVVVRVIQTHLPHRIRQYSPREHRIIVINFGGGTSELRAKSSDRPESLLGESLDFLIVDECASVRDNTWDECLAPRLIDRNGCALLLSTPKGRGWFYEQWKRGQRNRDPSYESWRAPTIENPHIDPSIVEAERARLKASQFAEQYEARFLGPPEPCEKCGGPSPDVGGYAVEFDDKPLPRCSLCGDYVFADGRTRVKLDANGRARMTILHVDRRSLTPQEVKNLQDFDDPAAQSGPPDAAPPVP
jgi:hypothetical protein